MRVLLLNQTFYPDHAATAQHAHDLARDLVAQGHEVVVVASRAIYGQRGKALPRRETIDGIEIHRVGGSLFGKASALARLVDFVMFHVLATLRILTLRRVDVVVPFTTPPFIVGAGWLVRLLRGSRCVYWMMDLYPDVPVAFGMLSERGLVARGLERLHRVFMRRMDRVVVLGRCMQQRVLEKGIPPSQLTLIRPWADIREIEPVEESANAYRQQWQLGDAFVVMYSGNLGLAHDVQTMLEAMIRLRDRPDVQFVFVGGGKGLQQLREQVEQAGLANVQFQPYQRREELAASLSLADVHLISLADRMTGLIVPSKVFGIMAAARPSILVGDGASEIGHLLTDHDCGKVVGLGDVDGLVEQILNLATHREAASAMGARARAAMVDHYDRRCATRAWMDLLRACVKGEADLPLGAASTRAGNHSA